MVFMHKIDHPSKILVGCKPEIVLKVGPAGIEQGLELFKAHTFNAFRAHSDLTDLNAGSSKYPVFHDDISRLNFILVCSAVRNRAFPCHRNSFGEPTGKWDHVLKELSL